MPIYTVEVTGITGRDWEPSIGPPTGLGATPGSGSVALSWVAPANTSGITNYVVQYKLAAASTYTTFTHPTSPATTVTVTGLVNGSAYDFKVASVVGGATQVYSDVVRATPSAAPVSTDTIFGFNTADDAPLSEYLAKWSNRAPMVRRYSGNAFGMASGQFTITTAIAPEKRVCYSTKADDSGPYTKAGLAAGAGNAKLTQWCESIPQNWHVAVVYYHEPNDDIRSGALTVAQYRNTYTQFRTAIDAANLQSGVKVDLVSNFMAYRVADTGDGSTNHGPNVYFHDDWVPPEADVMSFDLYLNPGHFTSQVLAPLCSFAEGSEYGASFPNTLTRFKDSLEAIVRNGYGDSWAILELNGPPRDYDGPVNPDYVCGSVKRLRYQGGRTAVGHDSTHTEVERAAALKSASDLCKSPPVILGVQMKPAKYVLYWQHPAGVNWNQKFFHQRMWDTLKPYITGTSTGGRTPAA